MKTFPRSLLKRRRLFTPSGKPKLFLERLVDTFERIPRIVALMAGFLIAVLLAWLYYFSKAPMPFAIFMLLPVLLVSLSAGSNAGYVLSIFSALVLLVVDLVKRQPGTQVLIPLLDTAVFLGIFLSFTYLLTEYKAVLQRERSCSNEDALTGIANLRGFFQLAEREIMRARRKISPLSVAYLGLDNLESARMQSGKEGIDNLLKSLAQKLIVNTRATDITARIGEEDFILLMTDTGIEGGLKGVRRLKDILMQAVEEYQSPVSFSIGLVTYNILPETVEEIIREADEMKDQARRESNDKFKHKLIDL
jgi:diguanylate cyclase (GGDEF)-like protein